MTTYLTTGCASFIGTTFVHYMLSRYTDIKIINLDALTYAGNLENLKDLEDDERHILVHGNICDKELVAKLIADYDPDYIINFAAESHVDRSIANPEIFVTTNVMGTVNLLQRAKEAWYDAGQKTWKSGKKYVQVSTDEVYGALGATGYFTEETPINPHSPYSSSKASADHFVKAFHDTYGMPVNITRCSNNYGQYQFPEKLIPLMINNAKNHKQLPVYGDGMQIRDWLYVEDHCKAIDMVVYARHHIEECCISFTVQGRYANTVYEDAQAARKKEVKDKYQSRHGLGAEPGAKARIKENELFAQDSRIWARLKMRMPEGIGEAVQLILDEKGITQMELAMRLGVSRTAWRKWCAERMSLRHIVAICIALDLRADIGQELVRLAGHTFLHNDEHDLLYAMLFETSDLTVGRANEIMRQKKMAPLTAGQDEEIAC